MLGKQPFSTLSQSVLDNQWWYPPMPELLNVQLHYPSIAQLSRRFCAVTKRPTSLLFSRRLTPRYIARTTSSPKNASALLGVSVSTISSRACILRPSCNSTLTLNQGELDLERDMDYCSTSLKLFFATIQQVPSLAEVFQHVPHSNYVFHAYSLGEARHSTLSSVRMELAELPDLQRMSVESIDRRAAPIAQ